MSEKVIIDLLILKAVGLFKICSLWSHEFNTEWSDYHNTFQR